MGIDIDKLRDDILDILAPFVNVHNLPQIAHEIEVVLEKYEHET